MGKFNNLQHFPYIIFLDFNLKAVFFVNFVNRRQIQGFKQKLEN